ncbi:hypothetical protein BDP27DRAFT_1404034 [Rhodocollybia butyracea]|uniref:Uncharacterized protein n=1 Tax=Rhodocollybia butyracea TaxID=206335 RepID=A0A9P5PPL6_9AGAR|nr:hypothetical protein BDP27DRAFT_1404034 [Rhodocollybia butyracea]
MLIFSVHAISTPTAQKYSVTILNPDMSFRPVHEDVSTFTRVMITEMINVKLPGPTGTGSKDIDYNMKDTTRDGKICAKEQRIPFVLEARAPCYEHPCFGWVHSPGGKMGTIFSVSNVHILPNGHQTGDWQEDRWAPGIMLKGLEAEGGGEVHAEFKATQEHWLDNWRDVTVPLLRNWDTVTWPLYEKAKRLAKQERRKKNTQRTEVAGETQERPGKMRKVGVTANPPVHTQQNAVTQGSSKESSPPKTQGSSREPSPPNKHDSSKGPSPPNKQGSPKESSPPKTQGSFKEPSPPNKQGSFKESSPPKTQGSSRQSSPSMSTEDFHKLLAFVNQPE